MRVVKLNFIDVLIACRQGSIILLLPPPLRWGEKKSAQGREFKVYKEKEGKDGEERKRGRKEEKKGKKKENKRKRGEKLSKKLVKKFRLRHTLEIY